MSMAPRFSLAGVGSAALAACALPSANISTPTPAETSSTPASQPAVVSEREPTKKTKAQRKAAARGRSPTVLEAELLPDGKHLRLQLSEPVTPTDGVDPNDFRLSMAMAYAYKFYAYAYYYDLGELGDTGDLLNIRSLQNRGDTLELELDQFIDPTYCAEMEAELQDMRSEPGVKVDGGIFLHYAPGQQPIVDEDGNAMAAIAAEWVLLKRRGGDEAYEMYIEGPPARRALREPIRVSCGSPPPSALP